MITEKTEYSTAIWGKHSWIMPYEKTHILNTSPLVNLKIAAHCSSPSDGKCSRKQHMALTKIQHFGDEGIHIDCWDVKVGGKRTKAIKYSFSYSIAQIKIIITLRTNLIFPYFCLEKSKLNILSFINPSLFLTSMPPKVIMKSLYNHYLWQRMFIIQLTSHKFTCSKVVYD